MPHPNGSKPPNPKYVPKQHGRMPKAPKGYHGQDVNKGCAVTALALLGGIVTVVAAAGYGIVEAIV